ncbi:hypothetical protein TNCV_1954001 [Trichonephila clavipes]|nr:hypothetical protein TNCV_1954001 [Trichonephila clavipes]
MGITICQAARDYADTVKNARIFGQRKLQKPTQFNMELEPQSPYSTSSTETAPLPCEELTSMKRYKRRSQIICSEKEKTVALLRLDHGHSEDDSLPARLE